jgi:hypothetical protein
MVRCQVGYFTFRAWAVAPRLRLRIEDGKGVQNTLGGSAVASSSRFAGASALGRLWGARSLTVKGHIWTLHVTMRPSVYLNPAFPPL